MLLFAVVLWPAACFGDSPDTRPSLFWGMFMVRMGAEVSCHVVTQGVDIVNVGCFIFVFIYFKQAIAFRSVKNMTNAAHWLLQGTN